MISLVISYIKHQSTQFKILFTVALILLLTSLFYALKWSYSNYQLVRFQKQEIINLQKKIVETEESINAILEDSKTKTKAIKKRNRNIDLKLKEDEKTIDNKPISDDELEQFLTKYDY